MGPEPGSPLQAVNASSSSSSGDTGIAVSGRVQLVLEILMVLMCLGAVTGNVLVIVIVAATKSFHSMASVLIMNLAVSDLLVGVGVMPFVALSVMDRGWADCSGFCLYVGYTSSVYCTASALTLAAIALDRYHSIMDCLRYSSRCTLWRTCGVVTWIWLQALLTSCPPLLGWSSIGYVAPMFSCAVTWSSSPSYTAFMAALSYLVPAGVILFCYVKIVKVARSQARRIHSLEDSVQRSRTPHSSPGDPSHLRGPSRLVFHLSGELVSELRREQEDYPSSTSRRFFSFLAQTTSQQNQNHHGVLRLLLVVSAFFLCWTPFIGVVLVQAAETAISGRSSLVPPSVVTVSYLLLLLNSDINPLLYALLSKRFQSALQGLRQRVRARLGVSADSEGELRAEEDEGRTSEPNTLISAHLSPPSWSEASVCDEYASIFTVSTDFKHYSRENVCKLCHRENLPPSSLMEQDSAGEHRRVDCLQVPTRPQEGGRLPSSALTRERQATFFFGQITVRVEHDVC